jgi:hypothetical protein
MELFGSLFIGKPLSSAVVAAAFLAAYFARRLVAAGGQRRSVWPLAAAGAWASYAGWEWLILARTPEANIRVDLLLVYPALGVLSAWAIYRLTR